MTNAADIDDVRITDMDDHLYGSIWRAFLEGTGVQYYRPPQETIGASIHAILETAKITPERVCRELGYDEDFVIATLQGYLSDTEKARTLGSIVKAMVEKISVRTKADKSYTKTFFAEVPCCDATDFSGTTTGEAVAFVFEKEGTNLEEYTQTMKVTEDFIQGLIERANTNETAAKILGSQIFKFLCQLEEIREEREREREREEKTTAQAPAPEQPTAVVSGQKALQPEIIAHKSPEQGGFAQWVQGKLKHNNARVLAKKWKDAFGAPIFTAEEIGKMAQGTFAPTVQQLVRIAKSEGIKKEKEQIALYDALQEQKTIIQGRC